MSEYNDGHCEGYEEGYDNGHSEGYALGFERGKALGFEEGQKSALPPPTAGNCAPNVRHGRAA